MTSGVDEEAQQQSHYSSTSYITAQPKVERT